MSWTQEEIKSCMDQCKKKAMTDGGFRKKMLEDPAAAIREVSGKEIPAGFKIKVVDSDPAYDAMFVLPPMSSKDVPDSELDQVVGGSSYCMFDVCAANACAADK